MKTAIHSAILNSWVFKLDNSKIDLFLHGFARQDAQRILYGGKRKKRQNVLWKISLSSLKPKKNEISKICFYLEKTLFFIRFHLWTSNGQE